MKRSFFVLVAAAGVFLLGLNGCVTKEYVKHQIAVIDTEIDKAQNQIEVNQKEIASLKKLTVRQNYQMRKNLNTVQEALSRAEEAGKVVQGKLLYEATISDESVHFLFDKSNLSDEAKRSIDVFAEVVKTENKNIFIEIQGNTDNIGSEEHNVKLGQARAQAVMRYLYTEQGIPLHRMDTFSYGESKPVADNNTRSNRAKNRRVTLVVME